MGSTKSLSMLLGTGEVSKGLNLNDQHVTNHLLESKKQADAGTSTTALGGLESINSRENYQLERRDTLNQVYDGGEPVNPFMD